MKINRNPLRLILSSSLPVSVRERLLTQLYRQTRRSLATLLILEIMFFFFLLNVVPSVPLFGWFILIASLTVSRLVDAARYRTGNYRTWHLRFAVKSVLTAALWGSVTLLFLPYVDDRMLQLMIFIFVMGIAGGAVSSIAFDFKIAALYLFVLLSPLSIYLILFEGTMGMMLAVINIFYYFMLLNVCRNTSDAIITAYRQEEKYRDTQQKLIEKQEELIAKKEELNGLFQQAPIGIFYFNRDLDIIDTNEAFAELFNLRQNELIGFNLRDLPDQQVLPDIYKVLEEGTTQYYHGPYHSIKGLDLWIEAKSSPLKNSRGEVVGGLTLIENKTKEKEALTELHFLAHRDPLTGLANRRSLMAYMQELTRKKEHRDRYSLLFYLDLNRFKQINDTLGHTVGDQLLIRVAKRLQHLLENTEAMLCRLGGDEFIFTVPFVTDSEKEAYAAAESFGDSILRKFSDVFVIGKIHLSVKCSIGIVVIEPGSADVEEIIRHADISMYQAKRTGNDAVSFYNPDLDSERQTLFKLQHDLNLAIGKDELELHYQPIVRLGDNRLRAAEALLRWRHPEHGLLPPARFLPVAIESGLIDEIGWWVTETVCRQIARWKAGGIYRLRYTSINLNATQLQTYAFDERFFAILQRHGVDPSEIKIELTETSLIENFEQTKTMIDRLQSRGIRCAIDDFGTGYSSLSYLRRLSFSVLKIDRAFIGDIMEDDKLRFLVESIISIGKRLGYHIVVEGIETEEQRRAIGAINDQVSYQGYLFSPAVDAATFGKRYLAEGD